jgi:hypothetical protein
MGKGSSAGEKEEGPSRRSCEEEEKEGELCTGGTEGDAQGEREGD